MTRLLRFSYATLVVLELVCLIFLFIPTLPDWMNDIALNLGTEILGILLTVLLIDSVIRGNEKRERSRYQAVALRQLRIPLVHHLQLLFSLYKASIPHKPEELVSDPRKLFSDDYFVQLAFFDFSKSAPVVPEIQWFDHLKQEFTQFRDALSRTVEKYALYLDVETVELVEQLINSTLLSFVLQAPVVRDLDRSQGIRRQYNLLGGSGMAKLVREHTQWFSESVESYNEGVPVEQRIKLADHLWRDDVAPQIGSARL